MCSIRIVLADDHAVVRKGTREFLDEAENMTVVAEATNGIEAKTLIREHRPDVAVLDIRMPEISGIEVTRWIRAQQLPIGVLILTAYDDDPFVAAALQAGANGYLLKTAEADDIISAVRAVSEGQSTLDAAIAHKLMRQTAGALMPSAEILTARETEVLAMAARGLTNRAIGHELGISDRTVQGHLANIYGKFQVDNRTEAVTKGLHWGMIDLPEECT